MIVSEVLLGGNDGEAPDAPVLPRTFGQLARRRIVVHCNANHTTAGVNARLLLVAGGRR